MNEELEQYHISVMPDETLDAIKVREGGIYFDGTLGGGGHSGQILARGGRLVATDRDIDAIDHCVKKFSAQTEYNGRYNLVKDNFKNIKDVLQRLDINMIDGAILDLGISSHQIDIKERGFSYMGDAILDMRMDRDQFLSALTVVNEYSEEELTRIFFTYGEEKNSKKIAKSIVEQRTLEPIETTKRLVEIIQSCFPPFCKGGHPAKKTFQALRIEVNNELSGLSHALTDIIDKLNVGGRLAVITFHSLEDRIVKQTFKSLSIDCVCDKKIPMCVCNHKATVKLTVNKGIRPTQNEQDSNPRSKSATLRVIEKL